MYFWKEKKCVDLGPIVKGQLFRQPFLFKGKDKIFVYYEDYDTPEKKSWQINVAEIPIKSFPDGQWVMHYGILKKTNVLGDPDGGSIADPTAVIINDKYYILFDMKEKIENSEAGQWRLGYAISDNGLHWTKVKDDTGKAAIIMDVGDRSSWEGGIIHAPEVFNYNSEIRVIYNATCTNSSLPLGNVLYSAGLARLVFKDGKINLIRSGRVTYPALISSKKADRVFCPFWYGNELFAVISGITKGREFPYDFFFIRSENGGEVWREVEKVPNNLGFHSFIYHDNKLWAIEHYLGRLFYWA